MKKKVLKKQSLKQVMKMPKFRNKRTGKVIEENLLYYVNKYRNHPGYEELKEVEKTASKEEKKYILSLKKKGKYYFKRENGFVFGPFEDRYEFDTFYYDSENPVAAVKKDGYWGYIDAQGNTIIPFRRKRTY